MAIVPMPQLGGGYFDEIEFGSPPERPHPSPNPPGFWSPGDPRPIVIPLPKTDPPTTPPEGMPAESSQVLIWFGPDTKPALGWVGPYASTGSMTIKTPSGASYEVSLH